MDHYLSSPPAPKPRRPQKPHHSLGLLVLAVLAAFASHLLKATEWTVPSPATVGEFILSLLGVLSAYVADSKAIDWRGVIRKGGGRTLSVLVLLGASLSGCSAVHSVFGERYDWNGPTASASQRRACDIHCQEPGLSDRNSQMCSFACTSLRDPWYSQHPEVK